MKAYVNADNVNDYKEFPYSPCFTYDERLLRSLVYAPLIPDMAPEGKVLVMDFDGVEEWIHSWSADDELYRNSTALEYISENLGRTIEPIRVDWLPPVVFINTRQFPFVDEILSRLKLYETRNRDTLGRFLGRRIMIAETGHGKPVVRCFAFISEVVTCYTKEAWEQYRNGTRVQVGSSYDWKPDTKKKVLYKLTDIRPCEPFVPAEGRRHGRVWMENVGEEVIA